MEQVKKNKKEYWRGVFRKVISHYDEVKVTNGTMSCSQFYKNLGQEQGACTNTHNPRIVRATVSDFICDVELTAKRVLTKEELRFFNLVYIKKDTEICALLEDTSAGNKFNKLKHVVQEKVGLGFIAAKIHPLARYYKPKEVTRK